MPRFDLSPAELRDYLPTVPEPDDFDAFWASTLAEHCPSEPPVLARAATPLT